MESCIDRLNQLYNSSLKYKSHLFASINKNIKDRNWVDIENEYYLWLKRLLKKEKCEYATPLQLNQDLEIIKEYLIGCLLPIQKRLIRPELVKACLRDTIYEPFSMRDISVKGKELFLQFLKGRWDESQIEDKTARHIFSANYGYSFDEMECDITFHLHDVVTNWESHQDHLLKGKSVPDYYLLPDQVLLLNFNYTTMADLYLPEGSAFQVNHIHGELENDDNPVIFGYGDELDEDYKTISNLNDNAYLTNIKSIRYLETDNYRRLLSFVDSAPYQIYIMGHSCGNSDRTLLNTLFEHRNCVSIKPYYHLKEDGTNNYIEIIQNISRNFNDMQLMRDRVVNKSYCRPLVPVGA